MVRHAWSVRIFAIHRSLIKGVHRISSLDPALCRTRVEDIYLFVAAPIAEDPSSGLGHSSRFGGGRNGVWVGLVSPYDEFHSTISPHSYCSFRFISSAPLMVQQAWLGLLFTYFQYRDFVESLPSTPALFGHELRRLEYLRSQNCVIYMQVNYKHRDSKCNLYVLIINK